MFYLYILYSDTYNRYYVGSSRDPWERLVQHNVSPKLTFTLKFRPWQLAAVFEAGTKRSDALKSERFIKKQKSRKLIEKLVDEQFSPTGMLAQLVRVPHLRD
ncbi:MAG: GIY-YIG nuclease family protein [Bacteroidota bacterium]